MHRNDIEIGLWPLRFCIYGLFWYAKCGFKWCKFVLNVLLFVLLGAYGVVLRCRHKVTEIFSYIKLNSLHLTKKNQTCGSRRKVNKRVDDIFCCALFQQPNTHGHSRREIGNAYYLPLISYYRSQFNLRTSLQGPVKQKYAGSIPISVA